MLELLQKNKIESLIIFLSLLLVILLLIAGIQDLNFLRKNQLYKVELDEKCNYRGSIIETKDGFKEGYACTMTVDDGKEIEYKIAIPHVFDYAKPFVGDYAIASVKDPYYGKYRYGVIDKYGTQIIPFLFAYLGDFDGKTGIACIGDSTFTQFCGIIDKKGNYIVSPTYPIYKYQDLLERKKKEF